MKRQTVDNIIGVVIIVAVFAVILLCGIVGQSKLSPSPVEPRQTINTLEK
jgi:hypothetical protein